MKKLRVLGVALLAIFAVGVITAASASAVTFLLAEWLRNGVAVTTNLESASTGELFLEDTKGVLGLKAKVLCSGILDGTVGANSLDTITQALDLAGNPINTTPLVEAGLLCTNQENCPEPLVWAVHLPWKSEVELMEDTTTFFADLLTGTGGGVGWEVNCMGSGITDECTTETGVAQLTLEGTTLLGNFSEAFTELAGQKLANCSLGGAESGIVEGGGPITLVAGGELSASSEGVEA